MVRLLRTQAVQRRRRKQFADVENAPESSSSSIQSDGSKDVVESSPSAIATRRQSLCAIFVFTLVAYATIGICFLPDPVQRRAYWKPITSLLSAVLSVLGFTVNVVKDVHAAVTDGRTEKWRQAIDTLALFLRESGLEYEWSGTLQSSLLFADLVVLNDIQEQEHPRRRNLIQKLSPSSSEVMVVTREDLELGQRYMRYATSVYGREMIASAELQVDGHVSISTTDTDAEVIARHARLSDDGQVWFSDLTPGENPNHESLRTAVVCDHANKQVVISIRGTFSLSGIIVDLAGFCEAFCGGWAHAGFAAAARHTWETVWETVLREKIQHLPTDYDLVLTGHSMGAGVAILINISLHHNPPSALSGRRIKCYAIAPPPVFTPLSAAPQAVTNTMAYVQGWDCVPSLSVDAIRRFMGAVSRIDAVLQQHPMWQLAAERYELGEPAQDLVRAYDEQGPLRPLEQAPILLVPARSLIWLEKGGGKSSDGYHAHALDPERYADRVLDIKIPDMMMDHLIPEYEAAFELILASSVVDSHNQRGPQRLRGWSN